MLPCTLLAKDVLNHQLPLKYDISLLLKETVHPEKVLSGGGQLPLGGTEITSKLLTKDISYDS